LSTYRSKSKQELRVAPQDEANQPAARNANEGNHQPTQSRTLAIEKLLTPREAEIARFVAAGLSNKQIARKANIAEGTVKIHLHTSYHKLGISNRAALAVMVSSG
jgi:two-component system, NarL family, nitrate/nitrite response regulator NarL